MKVVGLTSGGKDSCYSMMMCMKDGHDIVCLANLHPPVGNEEEIDSYMYQCVAHTGLQLYSEACGLPLYRREIRGRPIKVEALYEETINDEVEDLYELLAFVKQKHPDIEASLFDEIISSGIEAIIVKVAALGLSIKHLGKTLIEVKDLLLDLSSQYGVHVCGEGGEYETFVVDCPFSRNGLS
ncbi:Diphthine--ammonia ligase [Dirofilaria immitis]|nr:Diphthine--ammonia ligase [Dirofilaria immitis]